jgi:hypothetical protein
MDLPTIDALDLISQSLSNYVSMHIRDDYPIKLPDEEDRSIATPSLPETSNAMELCVPAVYMDSWCQTDENWNCVSPSTIHDPDTKSVHETKSAATSPSVANSSIALVTDDSPSNPAESQDCSMEKSCAAVAEAVLDGNGADIDRAWSKAMKEQGELSAARARQTHDRWKRGRFSLEACIRESLTEYTELFEKAEALRLQVKPITSPIQCIFLL